MKKIASVLLVLSLVSGSAFADGVLVPASDKGQVIGKTGDGFKAFDKKGKEIVNVDGSTTFMTKAAAIAAAFAAGFLIVVASDNGTATTHTAATHH